jgi:BASS family bile acid:Na+ symporter
LLIRPLPLLDLFVAVVMFSIGLSTSSGELLGILRARALLARPLVADCILISAIGFLLVRAFPLKPDAAIGIMLLAAIPGAPIARAILRERRKPGWPSLPL